eukprot:COSAG06_NODE_3276_length_5572_cov_1.961637_5_plen_53_part_00
MTKSVLTLLISELHFTKRTVGFVCEGLPAACRDVRALPVMDKCVAVPTRDTI